MTHGLRERRPHFIRANPNLRKGLQKDRLKKARSTTQLPSLRVEEYLKSMRGKD